MRQGSEWQVCEAEFAQRAETAVPRMAQRSALVSGASVAGQLAFGQRNTLQMLIAVESPQSTTTCGQFQIALGQQLLQIPELSLLLSELQTRFELSRRQG